MEPINRLFVYGTLAPGRPNEHILRPLEGSWSKGWVKGHLYEEGWGAAMGYPAIVLDSEADKVEGFLLQSDRLADFWKELDAFEGEAYERKLVKVELTDKTQWDAYIYSLKK